MKDYEFLIGSVLVRKIKRGYYLISFLRQPQKRIEVHHTQVSNLRRALDKLDNDMVDGESL
jgi:hypothetical protein